MSRRTSRHSRQGFATRRKGQITIVVVVVVSLFSAWTLLVSAGAFNSAFRQKEKGNEAVSLTSLQSNSPSKEYIYAGGRLVATEEAAHGASVGLYSPSGAARSGAILCTSTYENLMHEKIRPV